MGHWPSDLLLAAYRCWASYIALIDIYQLILASFKITGSPTGPSPHPTSTGPETVHFKILNIYHTVSVNKTASQINLFSPFHGYI